VRRRLLELMQSEDSASGVARKLGLPRQRVRYHVKELERLGLLRHVRDQRRGNCVERIVQATARRYLISPEMLGKLGLDPKLVQDRFSSTYLLATASRTLREVTALQDAAAKAEKKLPTLTLEAQVRFASPEEQSRFAEELAGQFATLVEKYHAAGPAPGRDFRFVVSGYPAPAGKAKRKGETGHER
jgi:predicted transcriptional regulator